MNGTLDTAERATAWLQTGGGWAMFIIACAVIVALWRKLASRDGEAEKHKQEVVTLLKEREAALKERDEAYKQRDMSYRKELDEKDQKIFSLLDKTNELLSAINKIPR